MSKKKQKYLFEPFLEITSKNYILIRPGDATDFINGCSPDSIDLINSTNIYFICKKPRLRFIDDSISCDNLRLAIGFELSTKEKIKREFFTLPSYLYKTLFPDAIKFSVHKEKNSSFVVSWLNGNQSCIPIELVIDRFIVANNFNTRSFLENEIYDYQVLYIGKSLENAYKRTLKHEKLQRILADIVENEPYNEVFILLINMNPPYFFGITDGRFCDDQSVGNFDSIKNLAINDKLSKEETVNIVEACLIKHFSPKYNVNLKNRFPTGDEKILTKFMKYSINSIGIVIETEEQNIHLFSEKVERNYLHKIKIPLHKEDNRITFQDILNRI